jgi:hypothetical protein
MTCEWPVERHRPTGHSGAELSAHIDRGVVQYERRLLRVVLSAGERQRDVLAGVGGQAGGVLTS